MSRYFEKDRVPTWSDVERYPRKWELYQRLIGGVPEGIGVKKLMLGAHWTYVEAETGVGVAMMVHGGTGGMRLGRAASSLELRDLAALATSWSFTEASAGVAALNAWYSSGEATRGLGLVREEGDDSGFGAYHRLIDGKRVAIVGHFPMIERLGSVCDLTILERAPQPGDIPDPACEYVIGDQDYLFCTGITLQNKTLPRLLELAREGHAEVIMVGPSVVPSPILFDYGAVCLAGSICPPERAADVKTAMEQGSRSDIFGLGLQKTRLVKPGWDAL